jgi:hypothetical protein
LPGVRGLADRGRPNDRARGNQADLAIDANADDRDRRDHCPRRDVRATRRTIRGDHTTAKCERKQQQRGNSDAFHVGFSTAKIAALT